MPFRLTAFAIAAACSALPSGAASARVPAARVSSSSARRTADVVGRIVDRDDRPVSGATVVLAELGRAASSDADGRFRFGAVPRGRYTLTVRRLGFVAIARATVGGGDDAAPDVAVTLDAGALPIEPVNVTATRAPVAAIASPPSSTCTPTGPTRATRDTRSAIRRSCRNALATWTEGSAG